MINVDSEDLLPLHRFVAYTILWEDLFWRFLFYRITALYSLQSVIGQNELRHETMILEMNLPSYHLGTHRMLLAVAAGP